MARIQDFVRWVTLPGKPVIANHVTVTPLAQSLTVRWPHGGFVWNHPVALLVERDGRTQWIPIQDLTRIIQIILLGIAVSLTMILLFGSKKEAMQ